MKVMYNNRFTIYRSEKYKDLSQRKRNKSIVSYIF